jgi:hypothetical protein
MAERSKKGPASLREGMFLVHNGVVSQTPKVKVREGSDDGSLVKAWNLHTML